MPTLTQYRYHWFLQPELIISSAQVPSVLVGRVFRIIASHTNKRNYSSLKLGQPSPASHPELLETDEVIPKISKNEFKERRSRLAERIVQQDPGKRHVIVIPSMDRSYMASGVPFIYRQHSNMHYLSGFLEPDSALVIDIEGDKHQSILYVKQQTPHDILWEGQRSGTQGSVELTGVDNSHGIQHLGQHLEGLLCDGRLCLWYNSTSPVSPTIHKTHLQPLINRYDERLLRSPDYDIQSLRVLKSPAELDLMRVSGDVTSEMFNESMIYSLDNPHEHKLFAKFDFECRSRGATSLSYLPVVAGGENACTVHYVTNDCKINHDDMVLVDAGSDMFGYVTDVTRTWPVSGKFTEAQRQLYEAVHEVYESCLMFCRPGDYCLDDIHAVMIAMVAQQLERLGVVKSDASDAELARVAQEVCPHHVGHYLGLDVHDTPLIPRSRPLEESMVICIEPGMYFKKDNEMIHKELRGVGVRIEDDFIIREEGYENVTSMCPTNIDDIEQLLAL